ncbi:MAG: hypothetical protein ACR652_26785 [Methylocystis sp.]|uniref:hypothetical protein n=1 Tax=Methylocystis sp. TaxID=1911079 RepID=UPI003DA5FFDB
MSADRGRLLHFVTIARAADKTDAVVSPHDVFERGGGNEGGLLAGDKDEVAADFPIGPERAKFKTVGLYLITFEKRRRNLAKMLERRVQAGRLDEIIASHQLTLVINQNKPHP